MSDERVALAADNNALWCDAVCRAHGRPGAFHEEIWINHHRALPFYPNAVTTVGAHAAPAQMVHIRRLDEVGLGSGWGVKDSFCALDLGPVGYERLFQASWIYRPARKGPPEGRIAAVDWQALGSAGALTRWERAWRGEPDGQTGAEPAEQTESTEPSCLFPASLLGEAMVTFLAAYENERIVAGAVATRTGEVVGLSNVFTPAQHGQEAAGFWAGCVAMVGELFPGLPIVGYEQGETLAWAQQLGFEVVGPLQVWIKGR